MSFDRRDLIRAAGSLAIFAGLTPRSVFAQPPQGYPFTLGVASGDPHPDGFVLWTRLAPKPLEPGGGMPMKSVTVQWQVAENEGFTRIVRSGEEMARPELGHSVHAEVRSLLPARRYWYRFLVGGEASPVGTVRSAPAAGAAVDRLRIGVAGCQNYESGYFTAYRHLSEEPDLDAVFHYGDYIYEHWAGRLCPKGGAGERTCFRAHAGDEIYSLDDYRRRYAQYKTDPDLQAAHAAAAFLPTWDDHEVDNNWVDQWDESGTPPEMLLLRRYAAREDDLEGPAAASEYVTTSVSSGGDGSDIPRGWENVLADNPHTEVLNDRRGYQLFTIGKEEWRTDVVGVDKVTAPGGAKLKLATLVTVPQQPGVHRA